MLVLVGFADADHLVMTGLLLVLAKEPLHMAPDSPRPPVPWSRQKRPKCGVKSVPAAKAERPLWVSKPAMAVND